ncbi:hypothetical protein CHS0354_007420 [Potamilus streckersoni]|uniref:Fibronectin type-III domain-containing protein n=1 Tax=Potamilus streckersoni TaxID=2493646 RepID=A0AAE0W379_9BIVA|nr:hypothetical protein CHS0354_007420 [Potamilus streckersoni]
MNKTDESIYVDRLNPYVNYTFELMAYTSCFGDMLPLTTLTLPSAPYKPTLVKTEAINATTINVTWTSPNLCTGITSYSVYYKDMVDESVTNSTLCPDSAEKVAYRSVDNQNINIKATGLHKNT